MLLELELELAWEYTSNSLGYNGVRTVILQLLQSIMVCEKGVVAEKVALQ